MIGRLKRAPTLDRFLALAAGQVRAVVGLRPGHDLQVSGGRVRPGGGRGAAGRHGAISGPALSGLGYSGPGARPLQAPMAAAHSGHRLCAGPLLSSGPENAEIDLSLATLRSVSPVHLEYLRNMGTGATLTVSLIDGDELWGLIACHHEVPRRISTSACATARTVRPGSVAADRAAKEHAQQIDYVVRARQTQDRLLASMPPEENLFDNPAAFYATAAGTDPLRRHRRLDRSGVFRRRHDAARTRRSPN